MSLLTCEWRKLAFANYTVSPEILEKHLPAYTKLDFFNGLCFLSLVAFQFKNVKIGGVQIPFHRNFEEINLRFYVKRFDGSIWRKGTVFLSEIVDKTALSFLANSLFHENYRTLPTKQKIEEKDDSLEVSYSWEYEKEWQNFRMSSNKLPSPIDGNSEAEFILDRFWAYGKHNDKETNEFKISHPTWQTYQVKDYQIEVDFSKVYGTDLSFLRTSPPHSVFLAEGSPVVAERITKINS